MQKNTEVELHPHAMAQGGDAVARLDGLAVFVQGALPGEHVRARLRQVTSSFARADVVEVLVAAPKRVAPRLADAPHMEWQHIDHAAQIEFKRQILVEQLQRIGKLTSLPAVRHVSGSAPWHYRNSARLHGYGSYLGYKADGSAHVTVVDDDPLLHPALQAAIHTLRQAVAAHPPPPRTVWTAWLRLSEANGTVVAAFDDLPNRVAIAVWEVWQRLQPTVVGVRMPWGGHEGAETVAELHAGIRLDLGATTFFQVSQAAATALWHEVQTSIGDTSGQRVVDAYCGAGTFTLPLAQRSLRVIGIEEYAPAIANGQHNAWTNGFENVEWIAEPVEKGLAHVYEIDAIVLDPPRRGLHPDVIVGIERLAPQRIVYVSCHPGTLARDLQALQAVGYTITRVACVDCFPQTSHVESVVTLERHA